MKFLKGKQKKEAIEFFKAASEIALKSPCFRSRCGSIIVKDQQIIGAGFNSPPLNQKLGSCLKDSLPKDFKSDKTCCIHAEQRAIFDALKNNGDKIAGSRIYFIRLDAGENMEYAGKPYCTICSKIALDVGIAEFVLWHQKGICVYNTEEYNRLSFEYV